MIHLKYLNLVLYSICWEQYKFKFVKGIFNFLFKFLEDIRPFCRATDTPYELKLT